MVGRCDEFAGTDAGAKIVACIAALPPSGGIADARGFRESEAIASDPFKEVTKSVTVLLGATTYVFSADATVPSNVKLDFSGGARLSINSGLTFTSRSEPIALPTQQLFTGSGIATLGREFSGWVYPQWWGITADDPTTDNTSSMQAAINTRHSVAWPCGHTYYFASQLDLNGGAVYDFCGGNAVLKYTGSGTAIRIYRSQANVIRGMSLVKSGTLLSEPSTGVQIEACTRSTMEIAANGFASGIKLISTSGSSPITLCRFAFNIPIAKTPLAIAVNGTGSFVTSNEFDNLEAICDGPRAGRVGISISSAGWNGAISSNVFVKPTIESCDVGVYIDPNPQSSGGYDFLFPHMEGNTTNFKISDANAAQLTVLGGAFITNTVPVSPTEIGGTAAATVLDPLRGQFVHYGGKKDPQLTPTPDASSCGDKAVVETGSTDFSGQIHGENDDCIVRFATTFSQVPHVIIQDQTNSIATRATSVTQNSFTITGIKANDTVTWIVMAPK